MKNGNPFGNHGPGDVTQLSGSPRRLARFRGLCWTVLLVPWIAGCGPQERIGRQLARDQAWTWLLLSGFLTAVVGVAIAWLYGRRLEKWDLVETHDAPSRRAYKIWLSIWCLAHAGVFLFVNRIHGDYISPGQERSNLIYWALGAVGGWLIAYFLGVWRAQQTYRDKQSGGRTGSARSRPGGDN